MNKYEILELDTIVPATYILHHGLDYPLTSIPRNLVSRLETEVVSLSINDIYRNEGALLHTAQNVGSLESMLPLRGIDRVYVPYGDKVLNKTVPQTWLVLSFRKIYKLRRIGDSASVVRSDNLSTGQPSLSCPITDMSAVLTMQNIVHHRNL